MKPGIVLVFVQHTMTWREGAQSEGRRYDLQKVVAYSGHFNEHGGRITLDDPGGLFEQYRSLAAEAEKELPRYVDVAMSAVEQEYDSHPTLGARIANLPHVQGTADTSGQALLDEIAADERRLSGSVAALFQRIQSLALSSDSSG